MDNSLSRYEFVDPIAAALHRAGVDVAVSHYSQIHTLPPCDGVILCGTALKDNAYLDNVDSFSWVPSCTVPVLGICAGMNVIASLHGAHVVHRPEIGLRDIGVIADSPLLGALRTISGYLLHTYAPTLPDGFQVLAGTYSYVKAFSSRKSHCYGVLFHPEVRNTWVLEAFAHICGEI